MSFLTLLAASLLGGFISQLAALYVVGMMAQRQEKKNLKLIENALQEHQAALVKEQQRLTNYARMES
jgi:hypothetical protein